MKAVTIKKKYQPPFPFVYPAHHKGPKIEEFAADFFSKNEVETERIYLPIYWTSYHVVNGYGKTRKKLQKYYNKIMKKHKGCRFFTIVNYDDGTLIDTPDCMVFSAGGRGDHAIPLICSHHPVDRKEPAYKASFVGVIEGRHPIRERMRELLAGRPGYYISESLGTEEYRGIMDKSTFALCPRGYGRTSFRLYEAMQMGCIPIYIYDDPCLPFQQFIKWDDICLLVHERDMSSIPDIIDSYTSTMIEEKLNNIARIFKKYFSLEGCCNTIRKIVEQESRTTSKD